MRQMKESEPLQTRALRRLKEPTGERFALLWFWCMIVCVAASVAVDVVNHFRYGADTGARGLLHNLGVTGFGLSLFFCAVLLPVCFAVLRRARRDCEKEGDMRPETLEALGSRQRPYVRYMIVGLSLLLCFAIVALFA